jgi:hypothetical protein
MSPVVGTRANPKAETRNPSWSRSLLSDTGNSIYEIVRRRRWRFGQWVGSFSTTKKPEFSSGFFDTRSTLENAINIPKVPAPACHQLWGQGAGTLPRAIPKTEIRNPRNCGLGVFASVLPKPWGLLPQYAVLEFCLRFVICTAMAPR